MAGTLTNWVYHDRGSVTAKAQLGQLYTEPGLTFPSAEFTTPTEPSEHSPEFAEGRHMVMVDLASPFSHLAVRPIDALTQGIAYSLP